MYPDGEGYPPSCWRGGGGLCIPPYDPEACELIVCVRTWFIGGAEGGGDVEEVMVWDRPGGGAAPKMFENAASRS